MKPASLQGVRSSSDLDRTGGAIDGPLRSLWRWRRRCAPTARRPSLHEPARCCTRASRGHRGVRRVTFRWPFAMVRRDGGCAYLRRCRERFGRRPGARLRPDPRAAARRRDPARVRRPVARAVAGGLRARRPARAPRPAAARERRAARRDLAQRLRRRRGRAVRRARRGDGRTGRTRTGSLVASDPPTLAPASAPPGLLGFLDEVRALIDGELDRRLRPPADDPGRLVEAMHYAATGPGKRLRPAVLIAAAEACGATREAALPAAVAVEMLHAYTLVHDVLPAMDDDDLRRGRPTVHIAFGESVAILAGDGLLTTAFGALAELGPRAAAAGAVLARRAG